jgi:hypothetical protein
MGDAKRYSYEQLQADLPAGDEGERLMSLRKKATMEEPHATYAAGDWTWKVLKVNAPKKSPRSPYVSWFCAVQSPYTQGGWDMGDTYSIEVLRFANLESSTDEFDAYLQEHV